MSQFLNRQLLSIMDTMEQANEYLLQLFADNKPEEVIGLLTDCQNCAVEIGTKIENVYGEISNIIHALEVYCEYVFQTAQSLSSREAFDLNYQRLCHQISVIRETFEKEVPNKKEIVFFPYNASMWDSLESIYLAALEDTDCLVYCVPIPYYEKNPDGSFGQLHYELDKFPFNIDVISYLDYDFKERRPDTIYIHNPYDNWNHVTSVHPDYYAKNLREYTDNLVYIPYFVLEEISPSNQTAINGMKHFCFLPGTIYAHKVIVQSENMKQIYVNEFIMAAAENGLSGSYTDRKIQEGRFLGLGSPKLDKISNSSKNDIILPDEWLPIIQKADGSYKKIVFYNTTIAAFLENKDIMLNKIEDSLDFFYHQKDDVALLWRPHPLMESTIKSMNPQLWNRYHSIVENYISQGWGIYDDTSDLNRAILLSDCYYGDSSSVVQLYQETGKPIMIQNVNILYKNETVN